ncbi:hypothetical protein PUN28_020864 [Cardiocondyla obscurior]|uniref:Uncharacterized protein n=1 Tax=Cardiocondyla obscurior TaxID=286306 RepID=A0AAW2EB35_9HYME
MKKIKKLYNNRVYSVLQSGWTDIVAEKLWQEEKLDCVISFKTHKVYISNEARCYVYCRSNYAITFCREEAKRLKDFGDKNPPILPFSAVLRKAKEKKLLKQHGLVFSNPVLNLLHNAKYGKYAGSIISISLLPFYCIYWMPEQQLMYKTRCKSDRNAF